MHPQPSPHVPATPSLPALPSATSLRLRAEETAFGGVKTGLGLTNPELLRYIYLQGLASPTSDSTLLVGFDKPILSIS